MYLECQYRQSDPREHLYDRRDNRLSKFRHMHGWHQNHHLQRRIPSERGFLRCLRFRFVRPVRIHQLHSLQPTEPVLQPHRLCSEYQHADPHIFFMLFGRRLPVQFMGHLHRWHGLYLYNQPVLHLCLYAAELSCKRHLQSWHQHLFRQSDARQYLHDRHDHRVSDNLEHMHRHRMQLHYNHNL